MLPRYGGGIKGMQLYSPRQSARGISPPDRRRRRSVCSSVTSCAAIFATDCVTIFAHQVACPYVFRKILVLISYFSNLKWIAYKFFSLNLNIFNFHKMKSHFETTLNTKLVQF